MALLLGACGAEVEVADEERLDRSPLAMGATVVSADAEQGRFLDDAQILVATSSGYGVWSAEDGMGPAWAGPSGMREVASSAGTLWLASEAGLHVLREGVFVPSPVDDALDGEALGLELSVDGLWIGASDGLHWYRGERLISPSNAILAGARGPLAYGLMPDATPGVWFLSGGEIYGVRAEGEGLELFSLPVSSATDLAADGAGTLWWLDGEGALQARAPDGFSWATDLASDPFRILASPAAPGVWVETSNGLFRVDAESVRPVEGMGVDSRLVDVQGTQILIADERGLLRFGEGETGPAPDPDPEPEIPTWTADVQPLAAESCFLCHGPGASARDLSTLESWSSQWTDIEENVRLARMPLPPLSPLGPEQLQLLQAWADAGFPE